MSKLRYVLLPDTVTSRSDRQEHYISGPRLASLYGVDPSECVTYPYWRDPQFEIKRLRIPQGLIWLGVRYDGDYILPKEAGIG